MILPPDKKEPVYDPAQASTEGSPTTQTAPTLDRRSPDITTAVRPSETLPLSAPNTPRRTSRRPEEDEPTEETALLPPPSYSEAVSQSGKGRTGRRWARYLAAAVVVVITTVGTSAVVASQRRHAQEANGEWKRGGVDGKGGFDHRWQHRTPFLFNETSPRDCDVFSEPRLIDAWRNGATARPVYESIAEHTFPLNDDEGLHDLWLHVRGSRAFGGVEIIGLGTEVTEYVRPPTGKVKVIIRTTTENMRNLDDWHFCRAGERGKEGIAIVGPNDGNRPVSSPWVEGYMKFLVVIVFPVEAGVRVYDGRPRHLLEDFTIDARNMAVDFGGDLASTPLAKTATVSTTNALIVLTSALSADKVGLETTNANIAAQVIEAQDSVILSTDNGHVTCLNCTAHTSFIVVHNNEGRITGNYQAGSSIDLVTSGQEISGKFYSPRIWVKNDGATITGHFGGVMPESQNGSLLVLTTFGRVVADIDFSHLSSSKKGQHWSGLDDQLKSEIVPIRLGMQSSDILTTITSLPSNIGVAIEASAVDGGMTLIAPDQLQTLLDIQVVADAMTSINLGDAESRKNKYLYMNKHPIDDGRWRGPVRGSLSYKDHPAGLSIPRAMSSISLVAAQFVNLVL